jgi:hypothetical protein
MNTLDKEEKEVFKGYLQRLLEKARKEIGLDRDELPSSEF